MMNSQKKTKSTVDTAYEVILDNIMNFNLKPGEVITEVFLSEKLGISRTPVRDAIRRLENEGLVILQNRTKRIYFLTVKDIEEIFDLKIAIESKIASMAALKGNKEQMDKLSNLIIHIHKLITQKQRNEKDEESFFKEWLDTDIQFHDLLFHMADNQRANQYIQTLNMQWHRIKIGLSAIEGRVEKSAIEHELIGKAIVNRDSFEAEKSMKEHLHNLKLMLLKLMQTFQY
jgi:DNA-binding GntR family transcriptional regulator